MARSKTRSHGLAKFEGLYCSGLLVRDPSLLTALCLLFEKVHFLNHYSYVLRFSKLFLRAVDESPELRSKADKIGFAPVGAMPKEFEDPFLSMDETNRLGASIYLVMAGEFIKRYEPLFDNVLFSSLIPAPNTVKLGPSGEEIVLEEQTKNLYRLQGGKSYRVLFLQPDDFQEFDRMVSNGLIPVQSTGMIDTRILSHPGVSAKYRASLLAMRSMDVVLPRTKAVDAETILEARERLRDYLPPFWAAMLKLSREIEQKTNSAMSPDDIGRQCQETVDTVVRPALVELREKLLKERRNWFYKIITPVARGLRVMIGRPPLTPVDLVYSGLSLGTSVGSEIIEEIARANLISQDSGLTYLLEVGDFVERE